MSPHLNPSGMVIPGQSSQCLTTLVVKKFLLISSLNLLRHNLRLFPLILSWSCCLEPCPCKKGFLLGFFCTGDTFFSTSQLNFYCGPFYFALKSRFNLLLNVTDTLEVLLIKTGFWNCLSASPKPGLVFFPPQLFLKLGF